MTSVALVIPATLLWVLVAVRVRTVTLSPTQRILWVGLVALAVSVTLDIPEVTEFLGSTPGIGSNGSHLMKHALVILAAGAVAEVVRLLTLDPVVASAGRYRRVSIMAASIGLLAVLFALAPVHAQSIPGLTVVAVDAPVLLGYWLTYLLILGAALTGIVRLTWHVIRTFPPGPLRTCMRWIGFGAVLGLGYCTNKSVYLIAATITSGEWPPPNVVENLQSYLLAGTFGFLVIGVMWPSAVNWRFVKRVRARVIYRQLYPLWRDYYDAEPAIALETAAGSVTPSGGPHSDVEAKLYRRVIEIRDGMLAVRAYSDTQSRELALREADEMRCKDPRLVAEAAWLEVARRAKLRGHRTRSDNQSAITGANDLEGECRVLTQIAKSRKAIHTIADRVDKTVDRRTAAA